MKILFCISILKMGKGGHYQSLKHISECLANDLEIGVISLGPRQSDITTKNKYFCNHFDFDGISFGKFSREINEFVADFRPDIIHCFDSQSFQILKIFLGTNYTFVVNQCGGANPIRYVTVEHLVLFSEENKSWFESQKKFKKSKISLIPNRVFKIQTNEISGLLKDNDIFSFMRIARIGKVYLKSIVDSIILVDYLHSKGAKVKLLIVGAIYEVQSYEEILSLTKGKSYIEILTDDSLTLEASKLLYLADAVVATGRGIMEASSLGIPVLTPAANSKFPILVTNDNFQNFFSTNFSQRNIATQNDLNNNIGFILELIEKKAFFMQMSEFSKKMFEDNFDVMNSFGKYIEVYKMALKSEYRTRRLQDFFIKVRTVLSFIKASKTYE